MNDPHSVLEALAGTSLIAHIDERFVTQLLAAPQTHKPHPLRWLLRGAISPKGNQAAHHTFKLTDMALARLDEASASSSELRQWMKSKWRILRSLAPDGYSNASGALGELRTAGLLHRIYPTLLPVREGKQTNHSSPDFVAEVADEPVYIEVTTANMNGTEALSLSTFLNEAAYTTTVNLDTGSSIKVKTHTHNPFGKGAGRSSGQVVIDKIVAAKEGDRQARDHGHSLLWIDFMDQDFWATSASYTHPVLYVRSRECWWTPGFWHALYGEVGTPLFEDYTGHQDPSRQETDGRFTASSRWDACVLSFSDGLVVCRNPMSTKAKLREVLEPLVLDERCNSRASWNHDPVEFRRQLAAQLQELESMLSRLPNPAEWVSQGRPVT